MFQASELSEFKPMVAVEPSDEELFMKDYGFSVADENFRDLMAELLQGSDVPEDQKPELRIALQLAIQELEERVKEDTSRGLLIGLHDEQRQEAETGWKNINLPELPPLGQILFYYCYVDPLMHEGEKKHARSVAATILTAYRKELKATTDFLTQLKNRGKLDKDLEKFEKKYQAHKSNYVVMMMDIDNFKKVNDTYGHGVGDEVLKYLARAINGLIRHHDGAYRYGGEELTLLLNEDIHSENAESVAGRIKDFLDKNPFTFMHNGKEVKLTVQLSIGWVSKAEFPDLDPKALLHAADDALYLQKKNTKNGVKKYTATTGVEKQVLEKEIEERAAAEKRSAGQSAIETAEIAAEIETRLDAQMRALLEGV